MDSLTPFGIGKEAIMYPKQTYGGPEFDIGPEDFDDKFASQVGRDYFPGIDDYNWDLLSQFRAAEVYTVYDLVTQDIDWHVNTKNDAYYLTYKELMGESEDEDED
jgi:hypothetical protein